MSKVAVVKEAVKDTLVGPDEPNQVSAQSKARFTSNAVKDAETGELYLGQEEFIKAIAPKSEDYVSRDARPVHAPALSQFIQAAPFSHKQADATSKRNSG